MFCCPFARIAATLLVTMAVGLGGALSQTTANQKKDADAKPAVTEQSVTIPSGLPDELIDVIKNAAQSARTSGHEAQDRFMLYAFTVVKASDKILDHPDATEDHKSFARRSKLQALARGMEDGVGDFARRFDSFADQLLQKHSQTNEAAEAAAIRLFRDYLSGDDENPQAPKAIADFARKFPGKSQGTTLFLDYARQVERLGLGIDALAVYKSGLQLFAKDKTAVSAIQEALARLEIIGKPVEIKGPTVTGESFDIANTKGKVVLVDFWASWCRPCVEDAPAVKRIYEKYHAKGFEIVGVSLDQETADLETFIKKSKIPWTQIYFREEKFQGFRNPLAEKYNVDAIPAMLFVNRQGNIAALRVGRQGEKALDRIVSRILQLP